MSICLFKFKHEFFFIFFLAGQYSIAECILLVKPKQLALESLHLTEDPFVACPLA